MERTVYEEFAEVAWRYVLTHSDPYPLVIREIEAMLGHRPGFSNTIRNGVWVEEKRLMELLATYKPPAEIRRLTVELMRKSIPGT